MELGNAVGNGVKNILGNSYRQSVLNDFSIVSKATFYVIDTNTLGENTVYSCKKILPVQINPHDIGRSHVRSHVTSKDIANAFKNGGKTKIDFNNDSDTLELELLYDIYDEYMAATGDGLAGGLLYAINGMQGTHADVFSLNDNKCTSLPDLIKCANDKDFVLFNWGTLECFGTITSLSARYDVFSRWGEPLKARVNVTITQCLGDNARPVGLADIGGAAAENANNRIRMNMALNTLALGATHALR